VIEGHGDVSAELPLNFHGTLRRERVEGPIHMTLKLDAVFFDPPKALQGKHLKPTGVGQHRAIPRGEPMEPAKTSNHLFARAQVQVVRVPQNDLGTGSTYIVGTETADDSVGSHRHEGRRLHFSVW
jgi:hypothetical protein